MPKKTPRGFDARIEAEIARHPNGIGIDGLHATLTDIVSRRTLQRRVGELADQKRIAPTGKGRGLRYRQSRSSKPVSPSKFTRRMRPARGLHSCLSEGEEIKAYVRQPRQQRKPVSYKNEFLEAIPHQSNDLSA